MVFGHTQSGHELAVLEDGLHERAHSREQPLAGIDDSHASGVGEDAVAGNGEIGIEARAGRLHIVEALGQGHLVGMYVGTVAEQLQGYTC